MLQAVEHGLNCPAVGIEPDDRLRRHGRIGRQQQPVLGPTPLDAQRDPDGADLQTAEEAGPEAAEADRHIVVDAEALLDRRASLSRSNRMPYLAGRPRPRRGRRKSAVSRRAWPTTVMPGATAQRTRRARMNHASTRRMSGRSWCSTAPMRILASLPPSRPSSDRRETRGRLRRRPGGPMTVESETRFCARTWVRFPGMVEPACGAWCCLRAAQE